MVLRLNRGAPHGARQQGQGQGQGQGSMEDADGLTLDLVGSRVEILLRKSLPFPPSSLLPPTLPDITPLSRLSAPQPPTQPSLKAIHHFILSALATGRKRSPVPRACDDEMQPCVVPRHVVVGAGGATTWMKPTTSGRTRLAARLFVSLSPAGACWPRA